MYERRILPRLGPLSDSRCCRESDREEDERDTGEDGDGLKEQVDRAFFLSIEVHLHGLVKEEKTHDGGGEDEKREHGDGDDKAVGSLGVLSRVIHKGSHEHDIAGGGEGVEKGVLGHEDSIQLR